MEQDVAARRLTAANRFGMGARPGDLAALGDDPRDALKAELARPDIALIAPEEVAAAHLASTTPDIQASYAAAEARSLRRRAEIDATAPPRARLPAIGGDERAIAATMTGGPAAPVFRDGPRPEEVIYRAEALARFGKVHEAGIGFVERLVGFWSNHFCVAANKSDIVRACAGAFEREAIRPHVLGRFADMLQAVERHPAMLAFLDGIQSVGPDSPAGQHGKRGLNENLAREIMELHTLGVDGGYGQGDVTAFANILTGWSIAGREGRQGEPGAFVFNARAHQPGDATVVGHTYGPEGLGQGERVLDDLARHPATARHIATKLARHFIADTPPPAAVDRLARVFVARDGDLRALASTLVDCPEAWQTPEPKLRNPNDLVMASLRLLGPPPADPGAPLAALRTLGMPLWMPPGPNGFADTEAEWGSPEGMKLRLDLAAQAASRAAKADSLDPAAVLDAAFGDAASDDTRRAVARAATRDQAVALILMAPEFQRR